MVEEVVPLTGQAATKSNDDFPPCWVKVCGTVCCVLIVLFLAVYFYLLNMMTGIAITKFITINTTTVTAYTGDAMTQETLVYNIWWPGCEFVDSMSDFEDGKCGTCFRADLMEEMRAFNKEHPGTLVKYYSRDKEGVESIQLEGWWLPAPKNPKTAPRIVLQHGFTGNSNNFRPLMAAYLLRKLGFSVLANNFRDHGYSDTSSNHIYEWGDAYPYDTLGAWDYARMDPDGVLGGEMETSKVGVMGFSKGAFTTLNVFGLEGDVPAVWVDSPPFTPKVVFAHGSEKEMAGMGIAFVAPLLITPTWDNVEAEAASKGVDLNKNLPEKVLPAAPDKQRPIFVTSNVQDDTVPIGEMDRLLALLADYPEKYSVSKWVNDGTCNGDDHCVDHIRLFDEYSKKACDFWKPALGLSDDFC